MENCKICGNDTAEKVAHKSEVHTKVAFACEFCGSYTLSYELYEDWEGTPSIEKYTGIITSLPLYVTDLRKAGQTS